MAKNDHLFHVEFPPAAGRIFELVRLGGGKETVSFHQSIDGAKQLAAADFERIRSFQPAADDVDEDRFEKMGTELVWELTQHYFKAGDRTLPDGQPRWSAQGGSMTSWQIYERDIFA